MMVIHVDYNGREVELLYSNEYLDNISPDRIIKGVGSNLNGDCQIAEEIAWSYLIRNASLKKPHKNLEKIIIINQNVSSGNSSQEIRIVLTGIPIFEKN
jgi:hypothetical protein